MLVSGRSLIAGLGYLIADQELRGVEELWCQLLNSKFGS